MESPTASDRTVPCRVSADGLAAAWHRDGGRRSRSQRRPLGGDCGGHGARGETPARREGHSPSRSSQPRPVGPCQAAAIAGHAERPRQPRHPLQCPRRRTEKERQTETAACGADTLFTVPCDATGHPRVKRRRPARRHRHNPLARPRARCGALAGPRRPPTSAVGAVGGHAHRRRPQPQVAAATPPPKPAQARVRLHTGGVASRAERAMAPADPPPPPLPPPRRAPPPPPPLGQGSTAAPRCCTGQPQRVRPPTNGRRGGRRGRCAARGWERRRCAPARAAWGRRGGGGLTALLATRAPLCPPLPVGHPSSSRRRRRRGRRSPSRLAA